MRTGIDKNALGSRIRTAREKLGWSQGDLARNLGPDHEGRWASQSGVAKWEGGKRLPLYRLGDIARVLGKTEEWLKYGDSAPASDKLADIGAAAGVSRETLAAVADVLSRLDPDQVRALMGLEPLPARGGSSDSSVVPSVLPPPVVSNVRRLAPPQRRAKKAAR